MNDYNLSIIVPAYNEAKRIGSSLERINDYLKHLKQTAEVIVVDDGSRDQTVAVVNKLQKEIPVLKLIALPHNLGKGSAVKTGVMVAKGKLILFTDADNSTPIEELDKLMAVQSRTGSELVIGSRYLRDSQIQISQPFYRVLIGKVGNWLIRLFLIKGIKDTQCGFKLFTNEVAKDIFSQQTINRFGFDMEMLVIAQKRGYKITEVPVSWFDSSGSRLRPIRDSFITLKDFGQIKFNLWAGRYDR